jgi:hypothetical protein
MVAVPQVSQYDIATVEARLFDVRSRRIVWSATTQTFNPTTVARETPGFAQVIIGQLTARGLIAPPGKSVALWTAHAAATSLGGQHVLIALTVVADAVDQC